MPEKDAPTVYSDEEGFEAIRVGRVIKNFSRLRVAGVELDRSAWFSVGNRLRFGSGSQANIITVTTIELHHQRCEEAQVTDRGSIFGVYTGKPWNRIGNEVFRLDHKPAAALAVNEQMAIGAASV